MLGSCPTGWEKFDKHCYLFRDSDLQPWAAARFKCLNQGGNLVSITSEQEQDFITFHYRRISAGKIWIGKYSSIDTTLKKKCNYTFAQLLKYIFLAAYSAHCLLRIVIHLRLHDYESCGLDRFWKKLLEFLLFLKKKLWTIHLARESW